MKPSVVPGFCSNPVGAGVSFAADEQGASSAPQHRPIAASRYRFYLNIIRYIIDYINNSIRQPDC
jgi:hypothetical protein